jgi:methionyl aminopeptidase
MKIISKDIWTTPSSLIKLKTKEQLEKFRVAGKVAAGALVILEQAVKDGTRKSLLELDKFAYEYIKDNKCEATFLGYHGFPNSVCISVNKKLVHGIPTNSQLQDGDIVSFDLGATFDGAIGDTALTCIFGEPKSTEYIRLIKATKEALIKGIEAIEVEKRLGVIGKAVWKSVQNNGYNVITHYGGHGIDINVPHASPFVSNRDIPENGIHLQPGMVLAVEPMAVNGSTETWVDKDGWTVHCKSEISSHEEHTIFIHQDHVEILTQRDEI